MLQKGEEQPLQTFLHQPSRPGTPHRPHGPVPCTIALRTASITGSFGSSSSRGHGLRSCTVGVSSSAGCLNLPPGSTRSLGGVCRIRRSRSIASAVIAPASTFRHPPPWQDRSHAEGPRGHCFRPRLPSSALASWFGREPPTPGEHPRAAAHRGVPAAPCCAAARPAPPCARGTWCVAGAAGDTSRIGSIPYRTPSARRSPAEVRMTERRPRVQRKCGSMIRSIHSSTCSISGAAGWMVTCSIPASSSALSLATTSPTPPSR